MSVHVSINIHAFFKWVSRFVRRLIMGVQVLILEEGAKDRRTMGVQIFPDIVQVLMFYGICRPGGESGRQVDEQWVSMYCYLLSMLMLSICLSV